MKTIFFDMDGTIADLYNVPNWRQHLEVFSIYPYEAAEPMVDMEKFSALLLTLQTKGYRIGIISWCSKVSTKEYTLEVRKAKKNWLKENLPDISFDEIHIVKYGTPKSHFSHDDILFDDEERNRISWKGTAFDASDILSKLAAF